LIPYFQIPPFHFFGLSVHVFEILTSIGIYLGIQYAINMAIARNLDSIKMIDALMISIVFGFLGAHAMHVLLYRPEDFHPSQLLEVWKGISSTGGFLVGGIACWIFVRTKKLSASDYGDCIITGVLLAEFFGRIGCFTVHDHPGILTSFPLAVNFPDGARFDLGLDEALLIGLYLGVTHIPRIRGWLNDRSGRWMISGMFYYGLVRFGLDFLRARDLTASDPRYAGLTPAQYVCLLFIVISIFLIKLQSDGHPEV
jgi:phosphatidylglycerol:prolipoprotein diacylglycerol transferase